MGHNSVVSGHPKSTGISGVDRLLMGPSDSGCHTFLEHTITYRVVRLYKYDQL